MAILVQSFLNSATKLSTTATTSTTVIQLKTLVNAIESVSTSTMQFYIVKTSTTATVLSNGNTLGSYGITTATTIYSTNNISTSTNKVDRQLAKLELARLRRQAGGVSTATYYRVRNIYNIDLLADKYTSNTTTVMTTSTLVVGRPWPPVIGMDNPANAAEPNATAWVLMDGPFGDGNGFYGGLSWRKMAPIGYLPYGKQTYQYFDETVRWDGANWFYENVGLGLVSIGTGGDWPWEATWSGSYTGAKITGTYAKTTNYPAVP
jgi:hypothetical protein